MHRLPENIVIRPIEESDIVILEENFQESRPTRHRVYWRLHDRGAITHLVAWLGNFPIGHATLRWRGPRNPRAAISFPGCPEILGLGVIDEFRRQGIASRFLQMFEELAFGRAKSMIGLAVGRDNDPAKSLYQSRGYAPAGIPPFVDRWYELNPAGEKVWLQESNLFMVKRL